MIEVEKIHNSRPLNNGFSDPCNPEHLTADPFLIGGSLLTQPQSNIIISQSKEISNNEDKKIPKKYSDTSLETKET